MARKTRRLTRMVAGVLSLMPALLGSQGTGEAKLVRIRVRDVRTRAPVAGVGLYSSTGAFLDRGDTTGVLRVRVAADAALDGQLQRVGYVASRVHVTAQEPGDSLVVLLAPATAQALGAVEVTGVVPLRRFSEFDRRRFSGGPGIFLTDSAIRSGGHIRLTDLFRRFPSIKVIDSAGTFLVTSARARKVVMALGKDPDLMAPCVFQIVMDGGQMPWGFDIDQIPRNDIHGIEVYSGPASVPVEYRSTSRDAMCGMIAIWTR